MKLHLNLSLRRALLAAMTAIATFASSATAGLVDARYDLQYYLDFGYNMGLFRPGATNITVQFKDGTSVSNATIPLMPNLDSYATRAEYAGSFGGGAGLVSPQYVASAAHCKEGNVYFITRSNDYSAAYSSTGYKSQAGVGSSDWSIQRLNKIVTEVAYTPYGSDDFMRNSMKLNETWLYRTGQGDPKDTNGGITTGRTPLGGLSNLSTLNQNGTGTWVYRVFNREFDTTNDTRPPLEISMTSGDSGSPLYAWDDANNQFVHVGFCSGGNSFSGYTGDIYICHNPTAYDNFIDSYEVKVNSFTGPEKILWGAQDATTGKGMLTQEGSQSVEYTGAGSGNTVKDHLGLTFSTADSVNTQTIELQGSVNMGAGAMTFNKGSWELTEKDAASTFNSAGFVVNGGADLTLRLTASANEEWRKVGEGIMTIAGSGNNDAVLRVGGGNTVYNVVRDDEGNITGCTLGNLGETRLDREGGYAASSIRLEAGVASIVLMRDGQFKTNSVAGDTFTFGNAGGLLNLNGHDLKWGVINQDGSGKGARIGNMTTQDGVTPNKTSTFTYTGTGTFDGCFMDEGADSAAKLAVVYNNTAQDATWTLTGNHDIAGGYTVEAGTLVLQGTPTPHSYYNVPDDWDYASMQGSDVTVKSGAAFQLSHHARMTGDVHVEDGGSFIVNQAVNADYESESGSARYNMVGREVTSLVGDVILNGFTSKMNATVNSSAITRIDGNVRIDEYDWMGNYQVQLTKNGNGVLVVTGNVDVPNVEINQGGLVIETANSTNWEYWKIGKEGFLAAVGIDPSSILRFGNIHKDSRGVFALTANQTTELTGGAISNGLYIGAWGDVSYGTSDASLTAYNGEWHLGGGTGTLTVNFMLAGDNDLIIGNEWSSGTVHLTNVDNQIGGDIIIKGTGNRLTYTDRAALGGAGILLTYGNSLMLDDTSLLEAIKHGAEGTIALRARDGESFDLDLSSNDRASLSVGADGDYTYTGNLSAKDTYRFGGSGNLTVDTALDGTKNMIIDGQGTTGSSVTFAREDAYTGSITAGGGLNLSTPNSHGDIGIHVGHGEALASVASIELQQGATLYMDGQSMEVRNLTAQSGSAISNNGENAALLVLNVSEGESTSIADGVLHDQQNSAALHIVKSGTGTLTMGTNASWAGGMTISQGTVVAALSGTAYINAAGGIGNAASVITLEKEGTLQLAIGKTCGEDRGKLGSTLLPQTVLGTGTIVMSSGGEVLFSNQSKSFDGTIQLKGNTRLYVGDLRGDIGYDPISNLKALAGSTIVVEAGSQAKVTNTHRWGKQTAISTTANFTISGSGYAGASSWNILASRLTAGALAIDNNSTVYGNITLAGDAMISSSSAGTLEYYSPMSGLIPGDTSSYPNNATYGFREHLGGNIRGLILGEGKTLSIGGNESMTITADSANTYGNLVIANGNGHNSDQFALRLNGGKAVSQTSTALGKGHVTLSDGLILRLAGTGTANQTNVEYTYANNFNAGDGSTIQSYNITNKLTGTISAAGTLNLTTANGGALHLAGGISGSGTVNITEASDVTLGGNQAFSGAITAGNGANLTLTSSSALVGTATITGTDSFTLNLEGTTDYTIGQISVTGENSALTLHFDFTGVPTAEDNTTWSTLNSSVSATTTTIALDLNMFNDISKGNYTLITSAGTGAYQLTDTMNGRLNLVTDASGSLVLVVDADNRLYWRTDGASNLWNTTDANWYSDYAAGKTTFTANANIMLDRSGVETDNSASARETIQLNDSLELGTMAVQHAAYEINGNGAITGTSLTVGNKGDLKLSSTGNKTFTGGVRVNDANLEISGGNLTAEVTAENGASFNYSGGTLTGNLSMADASADIRNATLAGNIHASGNGTLALQSVKMSGNRDFEFSTGKIASNNNVTMTGTFTYADGMDALQVSGMSISGGDITSTSALNVNTLSMGNDASITLTHNGGSTTDFGTITGNGSLYKDSAGNLNLKNAALDEFTLKGNGTTTISGTVTASQYFRIGKETVTLLKGANVTAPQLRLGDMGSGQPSTVSIEQGATLTISGSTDADSTGNSLLLAHWGSSSSTLKLNGGTLNARNTQMLMGWDSGGRFEALSGTANLKGIRFSSQRSNADSFQLGTDTTGSARVNLGSGGISGIGSNDTVNLGNGTIGALADFAINGQKAVNLIGTSTGTTFDTAFDTAGHTITVNSALAGGGNLIKTGAGTLLLAGSGTDFSGNITVNGGSLAVNTAGKSILESASSVLINNGTLDLSHLNLSDSANSIQIGAGQTFTFSENASINFGNISANTEYQIFNFSGGLVEGWHDLTAENIIIGGVKLSDMGSTQYTLGMNGYFSYIMLGERVLVWNGGSDSTNWTQTDSILTWTNESSSENTAFSNFDSVVFNSDADLTLDGDIHVKNLTLSEGVSLKTTGQLTVHGNTTLGNGFSWDFSGDTTLKFTEDQLKSASKIVVGEGATLVMTDKATAQNNTSTAFHKVSGAGNVELNLAMDNGIGFDLSGVTGDITVTTGRLQVNTSTFNETSTIRLASANSQLVFNGNCELKNDVVLDANTTIHANSSYAGTISGDFLGEEKKLTKAGGGSLTLSGRTTLKTLETHGGKVIIDSTSAYIEMVDGAMSDTAGGSLELAQNAVLNVSGDVWSRNNTGINLNSGAVLALLGHNVAVINTGESTASVKATTSNGQKYALNQANYEIRNARVVYTGSEDATLSNKLTNVTLENSISNAAAPVMEDGAESTFYAGSTLTVTNAGNTLNGVIAMGGDINLHNLQNATSLNLLEIAAGRTISAYVGSQLDEKSTITVTKTAQLGSASVLNASLTLADGATLEMDAFQTEPVILTGTLTFAGQVELGKNLLAAVNALSGRDELVLFTGLSDMIMPTVTAGELESPQVLANSVFSNVQNENLYVNYQVIGNVGSLMVVHIPEPATSTLSLLALSALAMRRRRK